MASTPPAQGSKPVPKPKPNHLSMKRVIPKLRDSLSFFKKNSRNLPTVLPSIVESNIGDNTPASPSPRPPGLPGGLVMLVKPVAENIYEPPLQAPRVQVAEQPLQKPIDGDSSIAFADITAAIAIDVSGSTQGGVLQQETLAVSNLYSQLSSDARARARIIPWNHGVLPVCTFSNLDRLTSDGGTDPTYLTSTGASRDVLRACSAWFLLTDGEIPDYCVRSFAAGVCNNEIHGTPCVIILFGYKTIWPVDCNISVGLSVFAATPDCLFLFHDIESAEVRILQAKGIFKSLLPKNCKTIVLDDSTTWDNLPQISYRHLAKLKIPAPRRLRANRLRLQSRQEVDLDDICNDRVDEPLASEIMENDDDLKSVLLVAQLRGQTEKIRRWVSKQQKASRDVLRIERPDVGQKALSMMQRLLTIIELKAEPEMKQSVQVDLREAHKANWKVFNSLIKGEKKEASKREVVIRDALGRIDATENDFNDGTFSASSMSAVSEYNVGEDMDYDYPDEFPAHSTTSAHVHINMSQMGDRENAGTSQSNAGFSLGSWPEHPEPMESQVYYIPGYRSYSSILGSSKIEDNCPLCGEKDTVLAMLLKKPPPGEGTPNFPQPDSRAGLAFPLAMGVFRETDIVSSIICCHPCAHTLVRYKLSFGEEEFTHAIPLQSEAIAGEFQPVSIEAIDNALARRFERSAIESVFLAVIYSALNHLSDSGPSIIDDLLLSRALKWTASELSRKLSIAPSLSGTFVDSTLRTIHPFDEHSQNLPLPTALSQSIHKIDDPMSTFLRYPVGGFVVMMLATVGLNLELGPKVLERATFQRLLFHLTEQHYQNLLVDKKAVDSALQEIIKSMTPTKSISNAEQSPSSYPITAAASAKPSSLPDQEPTSPSTASPPSSLTKYPQMSSLSNTILLSPEDLDQFERLGPLFTFIEEKCMWSVLAFLFFLREATRKMVDSSPIECFERVRALPKLKGMFGREGDKGGFDGLSEAQYVALTKQEGHKCGV